MNYDDEDYDDDDDDYEDFDIDKDGTIVCIGHRNRSRCEWLNDPSLTPAQRNFFQ